MKKTGLPRGIVIAIVLFLLASLLACHIPGMVEKPTKPAVVINSPPSGAQVKVGEEAEVHSTATDEKGVTRVELWVDGDLVRSDQSPTPQPVFSLVQRWTPPGSGSHTVEVRAYNVDGVSSEPAVIVANGVEVVAASPTATEMVVGHRPTSTSPLPPTPTSTTTPVPPTPTSAPTPIPTLRPLRWDNRLDHWLYPPIRLEPAAAEPGQTYWRLVVAVWRSEDESGGIHYIYISTIDETGNPLPGQPVFVDNGGRTIVVTEYKAGTDYGTTFPMFGTLGSYACHVEGLSDRVVGLGLGTVKGEKDHTAFRLVFQRTVKR